MARLTELKELLSFLNREGLTPNRKLSQNFLIDGNIVRKIISLAGIVPGDRVLEIGPGPGAMTEALLEEGAHVTALEKDRKLAHLLHRLDNGHLTVYEGDALNAELGIIMANGPFKLVANLPYHLTSSILYRFLPLYPSISSMTVMVQKEVAARLRSEPGSKEHGLLTVYRELYSGAEGHFIVSKECFFPKPKVDSAVLHLKLRPTPQDIDPDLFFSFLESAFKQRRKQLVSNLSDYGSKEFLSSLMRHPQARAEELTLDDFLSIFRSIARANRDKGEIGD